MQRIAEQLAAQKAARQKANPVELLPKEVMVLIFTYIHECMLTVHVPRLSKQWRDMTRVVWQTKCIKIGKVRKPLDLSWRRYYYADDLKLFPFHSATIGVTTYEEFARANKLTPGEFHSMKWMDRYFRYEKVIFTFGKEDNILRTIDFNEARDYMFPTFWEIQGISWQDFALGRVKEMLSNTNRNFILQGLPKEDQWTGYTNYTITISSIGRIHETLFYEIKFEYMLCDDHYHPTLVKKFEMISDPEKLDEYRERYMKMKCIIEYLDKSHSSYITEVNTTIALD